MRYTAAFLSLLLSTTALAGQPEGDRVLGVAAPFAIIGSFKKYDEALARAKEASKKLNIPFSTRNLRPLPGGGLASPDNECLREPNEKPCYMTREPAEVLAAADQVRLISVEYSSQYGGFKPGYYIVMAASGGVNDHHEVEEVIKLAKSKGYKDAYQRNVRVFIHTCGH